MSPRHRESTLRWPEDEVEALKECLSGLSLPPDSGNSFEWLRRRSEAAHQIHQLLLDGSSAYESRDIFRHIGGFQALLNAVHDILGRYTLPDVPETEHALLLELLQKVFAVLAAALREHGGNRKYFQRKVNGNGWSSLRTLLIQGIYEGPTLQQRDKEYLIECIYECLLICALDDGDTEPNSFRNSPQRTGFMEDSSGSILKAPMDKGPSTLLSKTSPITRESVPVQDSLPEKTLGQKMAVTTAEALHLLFELWRASTERPESDSFKSSTISIDVPEVLCKVANASTSNLAALHDTDLLGAVLSSLLKSPPLSPSQVVELQSLATSLLKLGVSKLDDAHFLYCNARTSPVIAELLITSLSFSQVPSYVHFDLSLHGFASIELPGLGRAFPPASASGGYTLSLWFHVAKFDQSLHTTLFGAFDASQTCFVLVYLEKDTHNLILQTSIKSTRPSVRFKAATFEQGRWYHIALTHRRPKTTSSSKASLFVDGEFVEQVKSQYPSLPPIATKSDSVSINTAGNQVQAFFGTPHDLASRLGKGLVHTEWRLSSALLFADVLSDDLLAVQYELGPRYTGNFQDCLGSFQTYTASAHLNLRNENLHPGKEELSDIVLAIRSKAGGLLPEHKILLNISAVNVIYSREPSRSKDTPLLQSLSKVAYRNLYSVVRGGRNALALNGAYPAINDALLYTSGYAVLTGDPTVIVPGSLDDAAWRTGGCAAICLALVEAASNTDELLRSLEITFASIRNSWRNSEAMERENGYGILAHLLRKKLEKLVTLHDPRSKNVSLEEAARTTEPSMRVLTLILGFVGYRKDKLEESVINNLLAYRTLLVDLDVWQHSSPIVQKVYYEQFLTFIMISKYHRFNNKRLSRMRVVRKWLEALADQSFTSTTLKYFIDTFRVLLNRNFSADTMRSLALYVTHSIYKPKLSPLELARKKSVDLRKSAKSGRQTVSGTALGPRRNSNPELSRWQIALEILKMYTDLLCQSGDSSTIKRFARTVTNKWLLYLLADVETPVAILAAKILSRLLVVSGTTYMQKFVEKTGGIVIMRNRLQRLWYQHTVWQICFAILFGQDIATIDFTKNFDRFGLPDAFATGSECAVVYPDILPVIMAMLQNGLLAITRDHPDLKSPPSGESKGGESLGSIQENNSTVHPENRFTSPAVEESVYIPSDAVALMHVVTRFLADMHAKSHGFREFAATSSYVQELLVVLYPVVVSADAVRPETELQSCDSTPTFNGGNVCIKSVPSCLTNSHPIVRSTTPGSSPGLESSRPQPPKRMSSYVLVPSDRSTLQLWTLKLRYAFSPERHKQSDNTSYSIVHELLELTLAVFCDQIFAKKDFSGLGLFMRVPPGFQAHQAYFETFILRNALLHIGNRIKLDQKMLWEPRVLTNLARLATHLSEAIYEGWFIDGAEDTLEFLANILEYLQLPEVSSIKSVRLCNQTITSIRAILCRIVLLRLSEIDEGTSAAALVTFLNRLAYWQTVLVPVEGLQDDFLRLFCYLLYSRLGSSEEQVQVAAANMWRLLLVQKSVDISSISRQAGLTRDHHLIGGFEKIMELDNADFLEWFWKHRSDLDELVFRPLLKHWVSFVSDENRRTEETWRARINKRREKLKIWAAEENKNEEVLRRHETSSEHWRLSIFTAEHLKRHRVLQDQQDGQIFSNSTWAKMYQELSRPCGMFDEKKPPKWQLDQTEGRNRMRMRVIPDKKAEVNDYQPKRRQSQGPVKQRSSFGSGTKTIKGAPQPPVRSQALYDEAKVNIGVEPTSANDAANTEANSNGDEDEFELVDDPRIQAEEYEDKNRKVMRSLQRGDQVQHVHNASRIIGLEAVEGILILGNGYLYLLDNLFQCEDGEIVNVSQAPREERDPYLQMISGRDARHQIAAPSKSDYEARSWRWDEVLSISKRRFLLRDVAIEVFFVDGRSYLLTTRNPSLRNELYQKLLTNASAVAGRLNAGTSEDSWRIDALRNPEDESQTLGSRFSNVFAQQAFNPGTRKWMKGEISNFHYLMLVNTLAGRTFNDLTQYPIFPWVLADYVSDELDLSDPRSFRDLTKPMGCQTVAREVEFKGRYQSFAEMGDEKAPPFHYGTHYSSAMIITSYLIRLQPFVHSYLLLQGGFFDHADRLFYSIEKAWTSASRDNMTDVRELIPEFYYLPEFLTNLNGYDFGERQGTGGGIDNVALPPWAKGDPKIFIAKHREALESSYVSQHLHAWIDLIFGHKQRGEAALEATNVFHHLSYHGAKDLDTIDDPVERLATIGIIHNFGQTPHQVFQRAHPSRELTKPKAHRLDCAAENLTRLPFPVLESHDRVASLYWSAKQGKLMLSGPLNINIGPSFDKYMEWGFFDDSVRFFNTDSKKVSDLPHLAKPADTDPTQLVGLFEHVHVGQLSAALYADSKTLITAGSDCTISVWDVIDAVKSVDLQPRKSLFGHRTTVTTLAVSRSFSTLLSASSEGQAIIWDLNSLGLLRVLTTGKTVRVCSPHQPTLMPLDS
ncbi:MAG: hypothetical protein Q9163_003109 [Psora crenata]